MLFSRCNVTPEYKVTLWSLEPGSGSSFHHGAGSRAAHTCTFQSEARVACVRVHVNTLSYMLWHLTCKENFVNNLT